MAHNPSQHRVREGLLSLVATVAVILLTLMLTVQVSDEFVKVTKHHPLLGYGFALGLTIYQFSVLLDMGNMSRKKLKTSGARKGLLLTCVVTGVCSFVSFTRGAELLSNQWFTALVICLSIPWLQFNVAPLGAWWTRRAGHEWWKEWLENKSSEVAPQQVVAQVAIPEVTAAVVADPEAHDSATIAAKAVDEQADAKPKKLSRKERRAARLQQPVEATLVAGGQGS